MRKTGTKRRLQENGSDNMDDEEDSRSGTSVTPVAIPKGKERDAEFQPTKNTKLTDLDDDALINGIVKEGGSELLGEGQSIEQTHYIIVPSYASWYDSNSINVNEKKGLPEFFNGKNKSKTPEVYLYYRSFIIDTYRLNPFEYLSATACRRNLSGDVCAILRVHQFLELWGLINYQVASENKPTPVVPPSTAHFMVLADTPMGIQPIARPSGTAKPLSSGEENKIKADGMGSNENQAPKSFVPNLRSDQYSKAIANMKAKGALPGKEWDDQETLLLLEALEIYKDDWNKVSDHVGSRTQYECILKFLQLPIKDAFIDEGRDFDMGLSDPSSIPFSQAGNPIMATVAFLASMVDPRISQAAAKAALESYATIKEEVPPQVEEAHKRNVATLYADTGKFDPKTGLSNILPMDAEEDGSEEKMDTDENQEKPVDELRNEAKKLSNETLETAAAAVLGSAAAKAKQLAMIEERKMKSLVSQVVELQIKKLEFKMKCFEELENIVDKEREMLELKQTELIIERQQFHSDQLRYLDSRARLDAQAKLTTEGVLPPVLPQGFEVSGPPQPTQTIVTAPATAPTPTPAAAPQKVEAPQPIIDTKSEITPEIAPIVAPVIPTPVAMPQPVPVQIPQPQIPQQVVPPVVQTPPQPAVQPTQSVPPQVQQQPQQQPPQHPIPPQQQQPPMMQNPGQYPPPQQTYMQASQYAGPPQHPSQQYPQPYPQQSYGTQPPQGHYAQPHQQQAYYQPPQQAGPPRAPYNPQAYGGPRQNYPPQQGYPPPQQGVRPQYAPPPGQYQQQPYGYPPQHQQQYYQGPPPQGMPPQECSALDQIEHEKKETKLVFLLVDAFANNFLLERKSMQRLQGLINDGHFFKAQSFSSYPTFTLPGMKRLFTGRKAIFWDSIINLQETAIPGETLFSKLKEANRTTVAFADHLIMSWFPNDLSNNRSKETTDSSLNRKYNEADNKTIVETLKFLNHNVSKEWDNLLVYFYGLDAAGHFLNTDAGPHIESKLEELDKAIDDIYKQLLSQESKFILIVTGDHGMNSNGNHGGSEASVTDSIFLFASNDHNFKSHRRKIVIDQMDITATITSLLNVPLPSQSLGVSFAHLLTRNVIEAGYNLINNAVQLRQLNSHTLDNKELLNDVINKLTEQTKKLCSDQNIELEKDLIENCYQTLKRVQKPLLSAFLYFFTHQVS
uniref:SWI/SNF complex subunit SMARCC2 n=1 Tax=Rhabditophanes sp. KR3021 TaxID=114890 RepID=A0AC35TMP8_9BILA